MIRSQASEFSGFDRLWKLGDPLLSRPYRASYELGNDRLFTLTGYNLMSPPAEPIRLRWGSGGAVPGDVVWPHSVMPPFVSERVASLLRDQDVTGWDSFPIEVREKGGTIHRNYHRLMVTATPCGPIDWTRGELVERTEVPLGRYFRGGWFDPATWDGSDIFRSESGGWVWVVERVRDLFVRTKIKNIAFTRFTDYEIEDSLAMRR